MGEKGAAEFVPRLEEVSSTVSKALLDSNPTMKEDCAIFVNELSKSLKAELGHHAKPILNSLVQNTKHQRSKIRKLSVRAIGELAKTNHAAPLLKDILPQLKPLLNDNIAEVRKELQMVVKEWLESLDMNMFECELALLLLAGLGDENEEIAQLCVKALEEHGKKILSEEPTVDVHSFDEKFKRKVAGA
eukprot:TRINITY_DN15082_c0_g3_i1.p2 TRINITY_DN15082_c0_g3~~TRINITY_DN15082_c0_g3_i1.p2  ORF type:complete len:189 (-),score=43.09 TRINITY_DN15082_c0_g3_i1:135-701(-)